MMRYEYIAVMHITAPHNLRAELSARSRENRIDANT